MINYRIIARVFSILLVLEGLMMLLACLVAFLYDENDAGPLLYSALITLVTGIIGFTPVRNEERTYGNREGYIIIAGIWLIFTLFGTLPYIFSGTIRNFTNAFFESISGFTTTGATVLTDIDSMPKGILFWRSLTQWIGGMGVIFLSLYVLPVFKDVNIQLSTTEFSGQPSDKISPRTIDAIKRLIAVYVILTISEIVLLNIAGMPFFDSVCQSLGTLSTGGFSTHNNSLALFSSPGIKIIITLFMFFAGTNMTKIYFAFKRDFNKIKSNNEFVFYSYICIIFSILTSLILLLKKSYSIGDSFINGTFHMVSVITTTGYYTNNYNLWGDLLIFIVFVMMFTGGTSGSASGGIKVARLMITTKNNLMELRRQIHPDAFIPVRLNQRIVPRNIVYNVLVFLTLYFFIVCLSAMVISLMGYDFITSFGTSAAMLGNIGPGPGSLGPFSNYSGMPVAGKWFMTALMLLGRLELMAVLILFARSFYRK
jgi:trk system potassium uptake protein TrkH